jgi:hypothetical protein
LDLNKQRRRDQVETEVPELQGRFFGSIGQSTPGREVPIPLSISPSQEIRITTHLDPMKGQIGMGAN